MKTLIVANWDWVLYNFRLPLARALVASGVEIILVCPPGKYSGKIRDQGFKLLDWGLDRKNLSPYKELVALLQLASLYRQEKPDAVHHFTIKPILYGSIAARLVKIPTIINNFTGLGYLFTDGWLAKVLRFAVLPFLSLFTRAQGVHTVFQHHDDARRLRELGIIPAGGDLVIEGTGVDLDKFRPYPQKEDPPVVLMAARLLFDKGVQEFVEAARTLFSLGEDCEFWIAGRPDPANPSSIPETLIEEWQTAGVLKFLGHREDIENLMQRASIAVLPSYHEGVPLFLLEAAATGLPLVGSDIEGIRLVIEEGVNGYLVPVGDVKALANAIQKLLDDGELRRALGQNSRVIAQERFGQDTVLAKYRSLYNELGILEDYPNGFNQSQ